MEQNEIVVNNSIRWRIPLHFIRHFFCFKSQIESENDFYVDKCEPTWREVLLWRAYNDGILQQKTSESLVDSWFIAFSTVCRLLFSIAYCHYLSLKRQL